jgi:hypothetical protein
MGKIKVIKKKDESVNYTFKEDGLKNLAYRVVGEPSRGGSEKNDKADAEPEYRLRANAAKQDKIKHKSKVTGGHSMQGHSPVYE